MADHKPICGPQGESTDDILAVVLALLGLVSTAAGVVSLFTNEKLAEALAQVILSLTSASVPGFIVVVSVAAAGLTWAVVLAFWFDRCLNKADGLRACTAGVVQNIVPSFSRHPENDLFPWTAMHDRVDVVVKSAYWFLVEQNAQLVKCNDDADRSPILQGLYKSDRVCAADLGAVIGGLVGGLGGILVGSVLGSLLCAAAFVFCAMAAVFAALISVVSVLGGAWVGGQVGKSFGADVPPEAGLNPILIGDYVSTCGDLITSGDFDGARVYWFVERTAAHGRSLEAKPYSFQDPDVNLQMDACQADPTYCPPVGEGG
ncbi:MAG TPA: hypothetical protein VKD90_04860 [Gemmataceae bacterium]|nr:hypothetical protein [Gemmataceae bacterium]